jgi:hypothetical protein
MRSKGLTLGVIVGGAWLGICVPSFGAATATPPPAQTHDRNHHHGSDSHRNHGSDDHHRPSGDNHHGSDPTATPRDSGHRGSGDDEGVRKLFNSLDGSHHDPDGDRDSDHDRDRNRDNNDHSGDRSRDDHGDDRDSDQSHKD